MNASQRFFGWPLRLWLLAACAAAVLVLVLGRERRALVIAGAPQLVVELDEALGEEGDTAAETLRTLVAQLDGLEQQLQAQREELRILRRQRSTAPDAARRQLRERVQGLERQLGRLEQGRGHRNAETSSQPPPRWLSLSPLSPLPTAVPSTVPPAQDHTLPRPVYTIPANAILFDAVALTALIGRVSATAGQYEPLPVKVLVGRDNLAANGHRIPGLRGALLSGVAHGDWTLGCISVRLDEISFLFADGTIRHVAEQGLAWLSDPRGAPCLPGRRITTAARGAVRELLLGVADGYAGAVARGETQEIVSDSGSVLSALSGDAQRYAAAGALQGALRRLRQFVEQRYSDGLDAIYAPPGSLVAVHIAKRIDLDYEPLGRRLDYGEAVGRGATALD